MLTSSYSTWYTARIHYSLILTNSTTATASSTSRMTKWQTDVTTCCCRRRRVALEWMSRVESFFFLASLFWWPLPSASSHKVILAHRMWWVRVIFFLLQRSGFLGHCEPQISWRGSYRVAKLLDFRLRWNFSTWKTWRKRLPLFVLNSFQWLSFLP